jgi:hypothetical protein
MTIREITPDDAAAVTDLYLDVCSRLSELDPDWGVPDREPIYRWILRTTESDEAVCLVIELEGTIAGCLSPRLPVTRRCPACSGSSRSSTCARARTRTG